MTVNNGITFFALAAAIFIVARVVFAAGEFDVREWTGHKLRLIGLIAWRALAAAGAVAVAAGAPIGGLLLLVAFALVFAADRRVR